MKKIIGLMMGTTLAVILAACGGGGDDAGDNGGGGGTQTAAGDPQEIYNKSCISCHGENLEGRNGPPLEAIGADLSYEEILDAIENGRPGMPGGLIQGEDAEIVSQWLADKK